MGKLRHFLSQAEMSDRRAKELCYYCDEKFTPEHQLKHIKTQLFDMDVEEELIRRKSGKKVVVKTRI